MATRDLTVGIIGVGNIGTVHLQSAQRIEGVRVTAVADADPDRRATARSLGVEAAYSDFEEMFRRESLDTVVVALPPKLHATAVTTAIEHGCDAFIEKPFAPTLSEAERMVSAANDADVHLGVDHTIRYQTEIRKLKDAFDSGEFGHVPMSVISRINNGPFTPPPPDDTVSDWQVDPGGGYGAMLDLGVHLFDVLEWFFGEMEIQHAMMDRQLNLPYEDTASVQLQAVDSGTIATLNCGFFQWETPPDVNMRFRLEGVAESVSSEKYVPDHFSLHAAQSAVENVRKRVSGAEPSVFEPTYYYRAHYRALEDFLSAVREGSRPPVNGEHGRRSIELVDEAFRQANFDRDVDIDWVQPEGTAFVEQ